MSRIGKRGTGNGAQGHCVLEDTKLEPIVLVRILWTWGAGAHTSTGERGTGNGERGRGTGAGLCRTAGRHNRPSEKRQKIRAGRLRLDPHPSKKNRVLLRAGARVAGGSPITTHI